MTQRSSKFMCVKIFEFVSKFEEAEYVLKSFGQPEPFNTNTINQDNWYETKEVCTFCQKEFPRSKLNFRIEFEDNGLRIYDFEPKNTTINYAETENATNKVCHECTDLCQLLIENIVEVNFKFDFNIELHKKILDNYLIPELSNIIIEYFNLYYSLKYYLANRT